MPLNALSESRLAEVNPELARRIRQLADLLSFPIIVSQGLRTWAQQEAIWREGRKADGSFIDPVHHAGVVTYAPPGESMHNFGLAVDVAPVGPTGIDWDGKDAKWTEILAKAPSCGLAEGAKWRTRPDEPHLYPQECPANPDDTTRYIYMERGIEAVWQEYGLISSPESLSNA